MNTSGHTNSAGMVLMPVGIAIVIGVILAGGPMEALQAVNDLTRVVVQDGLRIIHGML